MLPKMLPVRPTKNLLTLFSALVIALVPAAAFSATKSVGVSGTSWSRPRLSIQKGDTVKWTNGSFQTHTVLAYGSNWTKNEVLDPYGGTTSQRFRAVGTYKYRCAEHSTKLQGQPCQGMCGTVKVTAPT